jgi:hypothetical protein
MECLVEYELEDRKMVQYELSYAHILIFSGIHMLTRRNLVPFEELEFLDSIILRILPSLLKNYTHSQPIHTG